jgi:hypothetical protein
MVFALVLALLLIGAWWAWEWAKPPKAKARPPMFTPSTVFERAVADEAEAIICAEIRRAYEDGSMTLPQEIDGH